MAERKEIYVPALTEGRTIVLPEAWLDEKALTHTTPEDNHVYSAIEAQSLKPPTLGEIRHAFFGKNQDGLWISPEYRHSVLSRPVSGEWTSTFVINLDAAVERPERIVYIPKQKIWVVEGGKTTKIELPPDGFPLEYDKPTGFPSRTSPKESEAEKIFGSDRSYFRKVRSSLSPVLRNYITEGLGPFFIKLYDSPAISHQHWGVRSCRYVRSAK